MLERQSLINTQYYLLRLLFINYTISSINIHSLISMPAYLSCFWRFMKDFHICNSLKPSYLLGGLFPKKDSSSDYSKSSTRSDSSYSDLYPSSYFCNKITKINRYKANPKFYSSSKAFFAMFDIFFKKPLLFYGI